MLIASQPGAMAAGSSTAPDHLRVAGVSKRFGAATVLEDLSLSVGQGEFVSLLGPSGCGKTTLLRMIAGLMRPDRGSIAVGGTEITRLPAHKRNIGVVFQNYALFPHLTVAENLAFGLRAQGAPKSGRAARVDEALDLVRMGEHAGKPVTALSGGQQQRVAVARALVVRPSLLLLDEPFSALDRKLRDTMQVELKGLLRDVGITAIFVTHDQEEALVVSDRIAVMNAGRIEQLADPATLYGRPATLYVLDFVGRSTRLAGRVAESRGGEVVVETALGRIRARGSFLPGSPVVAAIRPEAIVLGDAAENTLSARVADVSFLGSRVQLHLDLPAGGPDRGMVELARLPEGITPGSPVRLGLPATEIMVFPAA
ncbi:ABC transporter ATP-binding protein [Teichococcus vastitatis]|uniref:ABC transporter ATP-binding protein n=1 Tax=Teichococcus vastitatis TaxID=2307076 RepID=A0ABS9W8U1_9PROT|nr:ABC transporter ATP-binding protein [Pseudoroseomonas vastitatis]MCI0755722.1 ABC transporter ATP-binding protein [Pseudoroseomonas vastitatis]